VAHYDEIIKEVRLALQECGRHLGRFLRKREHARNEERRRSIFEMYIGELVESLGKLTRTNRERLQKQLLALSAKHTDLGDENLEAVLQGTRKVRKQAHELEGEETE
jgi:DNA topoisomerase-6 subunit B